MVSIIEIVIFILFIVLSCVVISLSLRIRTVEDNIKILKGQRQRIDELLGSSRDIINLKSDLRNIDYSNKNIYKRGGWLDKYF